MPVSLVIPTLDRHEELELTLNTFACSAVQPKEIILVGVSSIPIPKWFPGTHLHIKHPSAAKQRNLGASTASEEYILFLDDDISVLPDTVEQLVSSLDKEKNLVAVAGRMKGTTHHSPGRLLRLYYRFQAGYYHRNYGAKMFGPAITTFPCYNETKEELIDSQWLNSACLLIRSKVFNQHRFPNFEGYSPFEDAYLTGTIAHNERIAFHSKATFIHRGQPGIYHTHANGRAFIRNLKKTARDVVMIPQRELGFKLLIHKAFIIAHLIRSRPSGWRNYAFGILRG